ncbi:MAG: hypothetical protein JW863_07355 [Chitinispirillaceae bacterium]|nr:hypothetical protein [Chitinispirillaceae bacterium]
MFLRNVIAACCVTFCAVSFLRADVIPPDHHVVARCVTIANLDEFPDMVIVGGYVPISDAQKVERYVVKPDSCLTKGYKFNSFYLFWADKSYFDVTGLENLPLEELLPQSAKRLAPILPAPSIGRFSSSPEPYCAPVPDSIPVVREELIYRLVIYSGSNELTFYLAEKITFDSEGAETRKTYEQPVGTIANQPLQPEMTPLCCKAGKANGYLLFSPQFNGSAFARLIDCHGRTVLQFTRNCHAGYTYHVRAAGLSAGMYWLRVNGNNATVTLPVTSF